MPAFLNRRWFSKAWVSLHLPLNQPGEVGCITPIPTLQGSVWKAGPKPKHETDEVFLWWERKSWALPVSQKAHTKRKRGVRGEGSSEHFFIGPTNWKEDKAKERLKPSSAQPEWLTGGGCGHRKMKSCQLDPQSGLVWKVINQCISITCKFLSLSPLLPPYIPPSKHVFKWSLKTNPHQSPMVHHVQ